MNERNGERPAGQGTLGITSDDPGDTLPRPLPGITPQDHERTAGQTLYGPRGMWTIGCGHKGYEDVFRLGPVQTPGCLHTAALPGQMEGNKNGCDCLCHGGPSIAAQAAQDFHDAYHTQGMKDAAGCLLCFDYDERHGQYHPETGADQDGPGCRDCDYPPNDDGWHRWDCPATADPRAAHENAGPPAPQSPDTPSDGVQVGDRFVHLVPAAYELQCSCGHQRENVQLSDFQTGPGGVYLWDCPSCGWRIEFDGADVHIG